MWYLQKEILKSLLVIKTIKKLETIFILQVNIEMQHLNLKFNAPNEISVVFHKSSNYDYVSFYHKRISKRAWGTIWMSCRKYRKVQNSSFPIEKEVTSIDKDGNESVVSIFYRIKFTDSARFMATSFIDNLADWIHKIRCKNYDCFLEHERVKDNLIKCKSLSCRLFKQAWWKIKNVI